MIANKELDGRGQINFTGGTDVTPVVDVLYGSLYQFAVGLTKSESDAGDLVQQTFLSLSLSLSDPTLTSNPRLLEDQVLVVYNIAPELLT